jgi:hypothetical protein
MRDDMGRVVNRDFALLVLANDLNTGYALLPSVSGFSVEDLPPEQQLVFDSFELLAPPRSILQTNPGTMTSLPPQQQQQQPLSAPNPQLVF